MVNSKSGEECKNLLRLSLQFFGEDGEDGGDDDDFGDDFFDDDVPEDYESEDEEDEDVDTDDGGDTDEKGADDDDSAQEDDPAEEAGEEDPSSPADTGASPQGEANGEDTDDGSTDANADLIAELRALGYVGNDIASLTADMKQKREAKAAEDAKAQKVADKADGKAHVRSGAPGKSATGDGTGTISERQVVAFAKRTGCSKEEARRVLAKHARMMA